MPVAVETVPEIRLGRGKANDSWRLGHSWNGKVTECAYAPIPQPPQPRSRPHTLVQTDCPGKCIQWKEYCEEEGDNIFGGDGLIDQCVKWIFVAEVLCVCVCVCVSLGSESLLFPTARLPFP